MICSRRLLKNGSGLTSSASGSSWASAAKAASISPSVLAFSTLELSAPSARAAACDVSQSDAVAVGLLGLTRKAIVAAVGTSSRSSSSRFAASVRLRKY